MCPRFSMVIVNSSLIGIVAKRTFDTRFIDIVCLGIAKFVLIFLRDTTSFNTCLEKLRKECNLLELSVG